MIQSFADKRTLQVWERRRTKFHPDTQRLAWNKLAILNRAATLNDLRVPPGNRLEPLRVTAQASTASASTDNGGSVSAGPASGLKQSRSPTTTKEAIHE